MRKNPYALVGCFWRGGGALGVPGFIGADDLRFSCEASPI